MKNLKVEIVTPVHNRRETTLQCLKSLARIDKTGLDVHIVVVDDGSTDGTSEAIKKKHPEVQIVTGDGSLFYCGGVNRGLLAALENQPDFILAINDDSVFHEQFLQRLIKSAVDNPHSVVGAMLLLWNVPHRVFQVDFKWNTSSGGWTQPTDEAIFDFPKTAFPVEGMAGNCILFPVRAIRECGLLAEQRFPHNWGDIEYVVRMKKAGWKLLVEPKAYVWCEPNTNPMPLQQLPVRQIFHNLFSNKRHPMNLKRQFQVRWLSAPTKIAGVVSFAVYLQQLTTKTLGIAKRKLTA